VSVCRMVDFMHLNLNIIFCVSVLPDPIFSSSLSAESAGNY